MHRLFGKPQSTTKSEPFLSLMMVANEDPQIRATLLSLLRHDLSRREALLQELIRDLMRQGAPAPFTDALSCLLDDRTAMRALELLEKPKP